MPLIIDKEGRRLWIDGPQGYNALTDKQKNSLNVKPMKLNRGLKFEIEQCRRTSSEYHHNLVQQKTENIK